MKKVSKRILSFLLVIALMLELIPAHTGYAAGEGETRGFTAVFYETEISAPSDQTLWIEYDTTTKIYSLDQLGYSQIGRIFLGWKLYREVDGKWRVKDGEGKAHWITIGEEGLPENYTYYLYGNAWGVKNLATSGNVRFYGQWKENAGYTVYYHESDESAASDLTTYIPYGVNTETKTIDELGFDHSYRAFLGWKVHRDMDNTWRLKHSSGSVEWKALENGGLPENYSFNLYKNGETISKTAEEGEVHLYATWSDGFKVFYHDNLLSEEIVFQESVTYGSGYNPQTANSLELSSDGRVFQGWRIHSPEKNAWRAYTAEGTPDWVSANDITDETRFVVYTENSNISSMTRTGTLHLYGIWLNNVVDVTDPYFGADGNDQNDDTAAIQKALNLALRTDGMLTVNVPAGNYQLSNTLVVYSNTQLISAEGACYYRTNELSEMLRNGRDGTNAAGYDASANIVIQGGVWDGGYAGLSESDKCSDMFHFSNAENITIQNLEMKHCCGFHFIEFTTVRNSQISNCYFHDFIFYVGTDYSHIRQQESIENLDNLEDYSLNDGQDSQYLMYDASDSSEAVQLDYYRSGAFAGLPCTDISVTDCRFVNCLSGIGNHHTGVISSNYTISNNEFQNMYNTCINIAAVDNASVSGNQASGVRRFLHVNGNSSSISVEQNTAVYPGTDNSIIAGDGITIEDSQGVTVTNNQILQFFRGVYAKGSTLSVMENEIGITQGTSVLFDSVSNSTICTNTIHDSGRHGVYASSSTNITICHNSINSDAGDNIAIKDSSADISNNTLAGTGSYNLFTTGNCSGSFYGNTYDEGYGIANQGGMTRGANTYLDHDEEPSGYTVYYHLTDDEAAVSEQTTYVPYGESTNILTRSTLGFHIEGKAFIGWKVYRNDTKKWRVKRADGTSAWAADRPEGGDFYLYADGTAVSATAEPGAEVHLYAQWADTACYKIFYHKNNEAVAGFNEEAAEGQTLALKSIYELNKFFTAGYKFLGWKASRTDTGSWLVIGDGADRIWSAAPTAESSYALLANKEEILDLAVAGAEVHLYAQWEETDKFTILYHEDDNAEADSSSEIVWGNSTAIKTVTELRYSHAGRKFLGWKVYREKDGTWAVTADGSTISWAAEPSDGYSYYLYADGTKVAKTTDQGAPVHLYGQWEQTDKYTLYYHKNDSAGIKASAELEAGQTLQLAGYIDLGLFTKNYKFLGWKVYRSDTASWLIEDASGTYAWASELSAGISCRLLADRESITDLAEPGAILHLYGQWEETDCFTILYYETIDAETVSGSSEVVFGTPTAVETVEALQYSTQKRQFLGWRVYREKDGTWAVTADGKTIVWEAEKPEGYSYYLYEDGVQVSKTTDPGAAARFYAEWEDTSDCYTILYHEDDNAAAGNLTSEVKYGVSQNTLSIRDLGYSETGRKFLGWAVQRESDGKWYVQNSSGKSYFAASVPAGGSLSLYAEGVAVAKTAPAGTVVHFYAQWETIDTNCFTIKYHETIDAAVVSGTSTVKYGTSTAIKTVAELGYAKTGRKFLGWQVYREMDNRWYVTDNTDRSYWAKSVPAGGHYYLYTDGVSVAKTTAAGTTAHFYGVWGEADSYTIVYHEDDNAPASNNTTEIVYGVAQNTLTVADLQYSLEGRKFLGWRVVRESDGKTYVKNASGSKYFAASIPSGGSLSLYEDGVAVAKTAPAGTVVHFYAQWADTEFTICYHETSGSEEVSGTSRITYGVSTPIKTVAELNYDTQGRQFLGWRAYREKDGTWYVTVGGKKYWSKTLPEGGSYYLYKDGISVAKTTAAGSTAHFYGQWKDTTFTIQYHENDKADASGFSEIVYGQTTPIKTIAELQYDTQGRKFLGWRAYREKDGTWYVTVGGKKYWSKTLPEGGSYYLYKDGIGVAKTTAAGTTAHFYGVWEDTTYTILYHADDNAPAAEEITAVPYGISTKTKTAQELGFSKEGKTFLGWRVVRESDGKTYVMNSSGKSYFAATVPKNGSLSLYAEGVEVAKTAPAGTIVHFYAQWGE
ncbi:MAG: right-handed parallel beta-helix repeat-containing protein [Lachnospiraceae bacterium]|nr:right-handed parallel beta-helix repeat-containing protein [Lachnospiraceae bacterium]